MGFEEEGTKEKGGRGKLVNVSYMTLQKAVDLGEYNPEYLATFPEWHEMSRHVQFQFIKQGLENREKQLWMQWSEVNNVIDFRLKPNMGTALENIQKQVKKLNKDRERLFIEYSV